MKKIGILGSTGSIGTQALDIIRKNPDVYKANVLSCSKSIELLKQQIIEFRPEVVVTRNDSDAILIQRQFKDLNVLWGEKGLIEAAAKSDSDIILNALVGMRGLEPTFEAIKAGKDIALANKETLVAGGNIIMEAVKKYNVKLLPVDSEHSAIFQSLQGNLHNEVKKIILTASGGPFRGYSLDKLSEVKLEDALKHPNWSMGKKITIDSATMMNKGLEIIEARWIFDIPAEKIEVLIHPQSIVHSMVEYMDNSIIAQLGVPDMRVPIAYAFSFPDRIENHDMDLDLARVGTLTFEKPDTKVFRCIEFAYEALQAGGSAMTVLNAANEELVKLYLENKIKFTDIQNNICSIMEEHNSEPVSDIDIILQIDRMTREKVLRKWS